MVGLDFGFLSELRDLIGITHTKHLFRADHMSSSVWHADIRYKDAPAKDFPGSPLTSLRMLQRGAEITGNRPMRTRVGHLHTWDFGAI